MLWDFRCSLLERHDFKKGIYVSIKDGYSKENTYQGNSEVEIHVGRYSEIDSEIDF